MENYKTLGERLKTEYKLYILAFLFILIADAIGQIKVPVLGNIYPVSDFLCDYLRNLSRTTGNQDTEKERSQEGIKPGNCGDLSIYRKAWYQCGSKFRGGYFSRTCTFIPGSR